MLHILKHITEEAKQDSLRIRSMKLIAISSLSWKENLKIRMSMVISRNAKRFLRNKTPIQKKVRILRRRVFG